MIIKVAKKADIAPGMVLSVRVKDYEIAIFNVNGMYCSYVTKGNEHTISQKTAPEEDTPSTQTAKFSKPCEVLITGDDICILVDD
ncbi:MAG TPA: hypothetical protein VLB01_06565 [Thermodesulfobacteriota bacterium]|nr:hypothetical protein [Thermodesulfobacteriota bacterium]